MAEDRGQKTEDRPGAAGCLAAGIADLRPGFTGRGIGLGITAAVLASLLIGLLWVRGRRPAQPVYQGRSLSEWLARIELRLEPELCVPVLRQALGSGSPELQRAAAFALGEFGSTASSALPDLERLQTGRDRYLASSASNAVQAILASQDSREDRTVPNP